MLSQIAFPRPPEPAVTDPVQLSTGSAASGGGLLDGVTGVACALRAPVFAVTAIGVSVAGHVAAGGALPGGVVMGLLLSLVGLGHCALVRRELSVTALLVALGGVQLFLHVALSLEAHGGTHHQGSWPAMVAAHVVADVAGVVWVRAGEAAAARLLRHLLPVLRWARPAVPDVAPRPAPPAASRMPRPRRLVVLDVDPLRGPPLTA